MHIPDGFVSGPVNVAGYAVSAAVCAGAVVRAQRTLDDKQVPLLGVTAAFIFAAQMLNFPVAAGTSGHFLGAALAAIFLGPLNACLIMALVLTLQCLLFGDGGLTALGTNIFNMGVVGGFSAYGVFQLVRWLVPTNRAGLLAATASAAWVSVVAAAAACSLELAASGTSPITFVVPAMLSVHAVIGVGEAMITTATVSLVLASRPDLLPCRFAYACATDERSEPA